MVFISLANNLIDETTTDYIFTETKKNGIKNGIQLTGVQNIDTIRRHDNRIITAGKKLSKTRIEETEKMLSVILDSHWRIATLFSRLHKHLIISSEQWQSIVKGETTTPLRESHALYTPLIVHIQDIEFERTPNIVHRLTSYIPYILNDRIPFEYKVREILDKEKMLPLCVPLIYCWNPFITTELVYHERGLHPPWRPSLEWPNYETLAKLSFFSIDPKKPMEFFLRMGTINKYLKTYTVLEDTEECTKINLKWRRCFGKDKESSTISVTTTAEGPVGSTEKTKVEIVKDGKMEIEASVGKDNQMKLKTKKEEKETHLYIYKAARLKTNELCIIKLVVPIEAKFAIAREETKIRVNRATPICIIPFKVDVIAVEGTIKDINAEVTIDYEFPVIYQRVIYDFKQPQTEAYSCVYVDNYKYTLGEEIVVETFDGDLDAVCKPGIHGNFLQEEALTWHGIVTDGVPIARDLIEGWEKVNDIEFEEKVKS